MGGNHASSQDWVGRVSDTLQFVTLYFDEGSKEKKKEFPKTFNIFIFMSLVTSSQSQSCLFQFHESQTTKQTTERFSLVGWIRLTFYNIGNRYISVTISLVDGIRYETTSQ